MTNFIVDPNVISFEEIKKQYENYLATRPDSAQISQFFLSSAGQTTIEEAAAYLAYLKYDSIVSRRENYLPYATTRGGVVAGGQQLGYSAFRGRNAVVTVTFTPSTSQVYPKFYRLGEVSGYGLLLLNELVVNAGTPATVQCIVGDLLSQTLQSNSEGAQQFRFTSPRVSEDIRISIGTDEVETSKDILDLLEQKFVVQSNTLGSLDAKYLNDPNSAFTYTTGSSILLEYVELRDLSFSESNVQVDEVEGTLTNVEITTLYREPETNESIQLKAPLENETKFVVRGRNDYPKLLLLLDEDFISAGGKDGDIPATVKSFALPSDLSVLSSTVKNELLFQLENSRPFGTAPTDIIDPIARFLDLDIEICVQSGVVGSPNTAIRTILSAYEKRLSTPEELISINFKEIEALITALDIVQISRIKIASNTWGASTVYVRGNHVTPVTPNGFIYEAVEFLRKSGATEPLWPSPTVLPPPDNTVIYGQTIEDNGLVWVSIPEDSGLIDWQANNAYRVGDKVKVTGLGNTPNASFQVQSYISRSGENIAATFADTTYEGVTFTADNSGTDGNSISLVFDGIDDIDTVVDQWNLNNPTNTVSFSGGLGTDVLNAGTASLTGGQEAVVAEPNWPIPIDPLTPDERSFTQDNQILWLMVEKEGTPSAWSDNTQYQLGDFVIPTTVQSGQENIMFQAVALIGKSGSVEPTFPTSFGSTVLDNEILWTARNPDGSPETGLEEEYYLINETVTIV